MYDTFAFDSHLKIGWFWVPTWLKIVLQTYQNWFCLFINFFNGCFFNFNSILEAFRTASGPFLASKSSKAFRPFATQLHLGIILASEWSKNPIRVHLRTILVRCWKRFCKFFKQFLPLLAPLFQLILFILLIQACLSTSTGRRHQAARLLQ